MSTELRGKTHIGTIICPITLGNPVLAVHHFPSSPVAVRGLVTFKDVARRYTRFLGGLIRTECSVIVNKNANDKGAAFLKTIARCVPGSRHLVAVRSGTRLGVQKVSGLMYLRTGVTGVTNTISMAVQSLVQSTLQVEPSEVVMKRIHKKRTISVLRDLGAKRSKDLSALRTGDDRSVLSEVRAVALVKVSLPLRTVQERVTSKMSVLMRLKHVQSGDEGLLRVARMYKFRGKRVRAEPLCH